MGGTRSIYTDLRESHRLVKAGGNMLNKGGLVLMQEEKIKRGMWKMAKVVDFPSLLMLSHFLRMYYLISCMYGNQSL